MAYSATDLDFLQTSFNGQVQEAEQEYELHFNFQGRLKGQIEGRRARLDIIPKLRQQAYQNGHSRQLAPLSRLKNQDLWPDFWPSRPNSSSRDWLPNIAPKLVPDQAYKDGLKR